MTSFFMDRFFSVLMVLGIRFLMILATGWEGISTRVKRSFSRITLFWQILNFIVSLAMVNLFFAIFFKIFPDVRVRRDSGKDRGDGRCARKNDTRMKTLSGIMLIGAEFFTRSWAEARGHKIVSR